jgi:arylsulfatase A-like enzyme
VRTDRYKLIRFYDTDEWELFDLKKDPQEMVSVYSDADYAPVVRMMKAELASLKTEYKVPPIQSKKD